MRERKPRQPARAADPTIDKARALPAEYADDVQALERRMLSNLSERQAAQFRAAMASAWPAPS